MDFETLEAATPDQIWDALRAHVRPGRHRETPVEEAIGHVLAADVRAARDFPPVDSAAVDGFAVRTEEFEQGRTRLRNVGHVQAGAGRLGSLEPGDCIRVHAGAPIPAGAGAVVGTEQARDGGEGFVEFAQSPWAGQHIDRRASLAKAGALVMRAGTPVRAGAVAALVAAGARHVNVFARPRVAQLTTGGESPAAGGEPIEGRFRDSGGTALEELVRQSGGETVMFGLCPDDRAALHASLELGLANELLCITGGTSPEASGLIPELLEELGVRWLIATAGFEPCRTLRIGHAETGCWVVALPGTAIGCPVCFLLFARPLLEGLQGLEILRPPHFAGILEADLPANDGPLLYQPAVWSAGARGDSRVLPLAWRGAGDPFALSIANALLCRPANATAAPRGEAVRVIPLDLPR